MSSASALKKAWRHQSYAEAPGLHRAEDIVRLLDMGNGDTVYDFGCGDGHMVDWLNDRGMIAIGLDMVKVHEDTVIVDLTQVADCFRHDVRQFGICLGMMDHIPEELVSITLTNLARMVEEDIYFTIPIRDLGYNDLIGRKVQRTLKPIGWWRNKLAVIGAVKIGQTDDWMTAHVKCH